MKQYSKQWSTATPGYLIFLVDQSQSMNEIWADDKSYSVYTAEIINQTINELIATNAAGETVKNRVFISLIGYGGDHAVTNIRSDYISRYADGPLRVEKYNKTVGDGAGGYMEMEIEMPIFIEPKASGITPMSGAMKLAKRLIDGWIEKKSDNPVPVIINISDGQPEAGSPEANKEEKLNTISAANDIMQLSTLDGYPLLFNVHIGKNAKEIQFPQFKFEFNDQLAEFLFEISSEVPEVYIQAAKDFKLKEIAHNSRGFISNASPETLIKFINFGSSGGINKASV